MISCADMMQMNRIQIAERRELLKQIRATRTIYFPRFVADKAVSAGGAQTVNAIRFVATW